MICHVFAVAYLLPSLLPADASPEPPNIIFLYTDDQAAWAVGREHPDLQTPAFDRLCREGTRLANSFAATPVCSPARASLISSRYGTEVGITDWINPRTEPEIGLSTDLLTWVEILQRRGYHTALFGKWHLGTADRYHPTRHGYDVFSGFREGACPVEDPVYEIEGKQVPLKGLAIDLSTDHAIEFIRKPHDRPFLACLHYRSPHGPYIPVAEDIWSHFLKIKPLVPDYPDLDRDTAETAMRKYLASVAEIDRSVGRILRVLDEGELADHTVVIFSSDQGYNIGHHGLQHKGNARWILNRTRGLPGGHPDQQRPNIFDTSLRVPTFIRWPGVIPAGRVMNEVVSGVDWYPTILAMVGAEVPEETVIRGRSFWRPLKGERTEWDNDLYAEYSQHHYTQADLRMYRTPEWKLVRDFRNAGKDELYHLAEDPGESRNVIASDDPAAKAAREKLNEKLLAKMREINDTVLKTAPAGGGS